MAYIGTNEATFTATIRNRGRDDAYVIVTLDERDIPTVDGEPDWSEAVYPTRERIARVVSRLVGRVVDEGEIDDCSGGENGEAFYYLCLGRGFEVQLCEDESAFGDLGGMGVEEAKAEYAVIVEEKLIAAYGPYADVSYGGSVEICAPCWRHKEELRRIVRDAWDDFCRGWST